MKELSIKEAASVLGVSEKTIRRQIKAGRIQAKKIDGPKGPEYRVIVDEGLIKKPVKKNVQPSAEGLSIKEAASVLGVSEKTIRRQIKSGKIIAKKIKGAKGLEFRILDLPKLLKQTGRKLRKTKKKALEIGKRVGEEVEEILKETKEEAREIVPKVSKKLDEVAEYLAERIVKTTKKETEKPLKAKISITKKRIKTKKPLEVVAKETASEKNKEEIQKKGEIKIPVYITKKIPETKAKPVIKETKDIYKQIFHDLLERHEKMMSNFGYLQAELQSKLPSLEELIAALKERNKELEKSLTEKDKFIIGLTKELEETREQLEKYIEKVTGEVKKDVFPTFRRWLGL